MDRNSGEFRYESEGEQVLPESSLRILVVDDSALYRQLVRNVLRDVPDVEVVGVAKSGDEAIEMIGKLDPDLITLDVQMPGKDGIEVLRDIKRKRLRTKAIMLSGLTAQGAQVTTDALLEGAFDFILKPAGADADANRRMLLAELIEKTRGIRDGRTMPRTATSFSGLDLKPSNARSQISIAPATKRDVVVIGTSTGGPVALREIIPPMPGDFPVPILIVQHMPPQYTHSLAQRLNEASEIEVVEACDGMDLEAGWAYLAPGGRQMKIQTRGTRQQIRITDDPPEHGVRPAVDYLFRSVAEIFEGRVVAVILTGMGRDGLEGCRELKRRGAFVMAQHPDGCIVYGMPKAVAEEGLADKSVPLENIGGEIIASVRRAS